MNIPGSIGLGTTSSKFSTLISREPAIDSVDALLPTSRLKRISNKINGKLALFFDYPPTVHNREERLWYPFGDLESTDGASVSIGNAGPDPLRKVSYSARLQQ